MERMNMDGEAEPVAPRTRLVIRHMVLENFKSYAGSRTIGPFDKVSPVGWTAFVDGD